ncbi:ROK family protein, partial [Oharaeibacter diazotrophicus]
ARAAAVLDDVARDAATGLAAVVALLDPDALVLGGSIGVRPEFAGRVGLHMNRLLPFEVDLRTSALGRAAGMLGAVHAAAETARADAALLAGRQP